MAGVGAGGGGAGLVDEPPVEGTDDIAETMGLSNSKGV